MENANELIRECEAVLIRYNLFHKRSDEEEYLENKYKYQITIFVLLNRLLHLVQRNHFNIYTEKPSLEANLKLLGQIYFDRYQLDGYFDNSWHHILIKPLSTSFENLYPYFDNIDTLNLKSYDNKIEYRNFGFKITNPKDFSESLFSKMIKTLFDTKVTIKHTNRKKIYNEISFEIALKYAQKDGIYKLLSNPIYKGTGDNKYNGKKISENLFTENPKKYLADVNFNLNNDFEYLIKNDIGNREKHIYYKLKTNESFNLKFFKFINSKKIEMHPTFLEHLKVYEIRIS